MSFFRISGRSAVGPTFSLPGTPSAAPTNVTSITQDSGAIVSFLPGSAGSSAISSYTVTPYVSGSAQTPTTVSSGSVTTISGSNGNTFSQIPVSGLTNGTAYTFTVKAANNSGNGAESVQSGANTPLSGLVFGDDFNGPVGGPIDPEWWVYTRCGYLAQSEVEYYLPSQVALDGGSNLVLTAQHTSHTGPSYPSAGGGSVTQPWISGSVQSNTRTYTPVHTTMTFEARMLVPADSGNGFWPSFWLEGSSNLTAWKTDPNQPGWDDTTSAEIDVNEWPASMPITGYGANVFTSVSNPASVNPGVGNFSAAQHVFQVQWKPGTSVTWLCDGTVQRTVSSSVPLAAADFFLLVYLQMVAGGPTTTESVVVDHIRVFDQ